jgi:hypothetical protein
MATPFHTPKYCSVTFKTEPIVCQMEQKAILRLPSVVVNETVVRSSVAMETNVNGCCGNKTADASRKQH